MNALDLGKILGLVKKAAIKGYVDAGSGFIYPEIPIKIESYAKELENRIIGGTLSPEMAVIKAYDYGAQAYLDKVRPLV